MQLKHGSLKRSSPGACRCLVPASAGSALARSTPVPVRCRATAGWVPAGAGLLGSRQFWLGAGLVSARRCRLGSRQSLLGSRAFLVYPDQISSTPKGSMSIYSPELRRHPNNASISLLPPHYLGPYVCAILMQLLQRVNQHIVTTGCVSKGVLCSIELGLSKVPYMQKKNQIRPFENENVIQ